MSDSAESQDYGRSVDHGGEHKDRAPASVLGGASAKGGPTDQEDPKGEVCTTSIYIGATKRNLYQLTMLDHSQYLDMIRRINLILPIKSPAAMMERELFLRSWAGNVLFPCDMLERLTLVFSLAKGGNSSG